LKQGVPHLSSSKSTKSEAGLGICSKPTGFSIPLVDLSSGEARISASSRKHQPLGGIQKNVNAFTSSPMKSERSPVKTKSRLATAIHTQILRQSTVLQNL
jgi:hypothetical protein